MISRRLYCNCINKLARPLCEPARLNLTIRDCPVQIIEDNSKKIIFLTKYFLFRERRTYTSIINKTRDLQICVLFIFLPHNTPAAAQEEVQKKKKGWNVKRIPRIQYNLIKNTKIWGCKSKEFNLVINCLLSMDTEKALQKIYAVTNFKKNLKQNWNVLHHFRIVEAYRKFVKIDPYIWHPILNITYFYITFWSWTLK